MQEKDIILDVQGLYKLYGANKKTAYEMLARGADKNEILKRTGVTVAIDDVSFQVERGKIFVLIGLSGSGKSTVVRCLNRLLNPSAGNILFEGRDIGAFGRRELREFRRKKISMVFQSFGLMSHRDVLGNVAYGLEMRDMGKKAREERAMEMIHMVGLEEWAHKNIDDLSGGMRQRVGIARALANDPDVLLMDEPFSALDPLVRHDMQFELLSIQERLNKTVVFITHDINEAFKLGNTVSIMRDGRIVQTDTPEGMASSPADEYVENFMSGADKSRVYSVKSIMQKPACLVNAAAGAQNALKQMRKQGVSSAYVVGEKMRFLGVLPLEQALAVRRGETTFADAIEADVATAALEDSVSDLMPIAAGAKYPIAVVDENRRLRGIVTKAEILSTLI
jgi:glycine betaine/proline transport system ATP-binding protein